MKRYEGMFIIKPDMSEDDVKKTVTSIEEAIQKEKGKIEKCDKWARRKLAYPIRKYTEGDYYLCIFEAEPVSISVIESTYRLNENILRALITVEGS